MKLEFTTLFLLIGLSNQQITVDGSDKRCYNPPPDGGHICFCKEYQHNSVCEDFTLKRSLDTYEAISCRLLEPDMMCTMEYIYPTCNEFYDDVTPEEWRACLDGNHYYESKTFLYIEAELKRLYNRTDSCRGKGCARARRNREAKLKENGTVEEIPVDEEMLIEEVRPEPETVTVDMEMPPEEAPEPEHDGEYDEMEDEHEPYGDFDHYDEDMEYREDASYSKWLVSSLMSSVVLLSTLYV